MQSDMISPVIDQFNNLIDSLMADYDNFNMDEDTLGFLANKTRNFITFNQLTLFDVIFVNLEKADIGDYSFDDIMSKCRSVLDSIFDSLNASIDNILAGEDECEHHHDHSHAQHHYHVHVDEVQDDVANIRDNLLVLRDLIQDVGDMISGISLYKSGDISRENFDEKYHIFDEKITTMSNN